eukprot:SAG22_NODE_14683_length_368_cov_0.710037_1_plen_20_part_10
MSAVRRARLAQLGRRVSGVS